MLTHTYHYNTNPLLHVLPVSPPPHFIPCMLNFWCSPTHTHHITIPIHLPPSPAQNKKNPSLNLHKTPTYHIADQAHYHRWPTVALGAVDVLEWVEWAVECALLHKVAKVHLVDDVCHVWVIRLLARCVRGDVEVSGYLVEQTEMKSNEMNVFGNAYTVYWPGYNMG